MPRNRSQRHADRLAQGRDAVFTAREAVELVGAALGGTDQERLELFRGAGLVHVVVGVRGDAREVCFWGEVQDFVRSRSRDTDPAKPAPRPKPPKLPKPYPL